MDLGLNGKIVMISGGANGLGLAIARLFAAEGALLSLCSRNSANLEEASRLIAHEFGSSPLVYAADLADKRQIENWVAATTAHYGKIDVLINNASGTRGGSFLSISAEQIADGMAVKLFGYLDTVRAVLPVMRDHRAGVIINVVGVTGAQPVAGAFSGALAGGALLSFTKALSNELAADGIRVNAVSPGMTATHRHDAMLSAMINSGMTYDEAEAASVRDIPLGRPADPAEIGSMVVFLASERASYITGTNINVDGGFTRSIV
ncbi:SDR family oxidoreductase [Sphingobium sp. MK2]|uniref:SDR family NAD(P)-dependent oxidoreductase n=1 Tax=Sphingobium sp. MK2 TaxID=3116540 RepID=UPI0032E35868